MQHKGLIVETQQIQKEEIYDNTSDNKIKITEAKAKLLYQKYTGAPVKNTIFSNLGLTIAFITPLVTSDFKDIWVIPPEVLRDIFIILSAISAYRFLASIIQYFSKGRSLNEENFIRELCGQEKETIIKKRQKQNKKIEAAHRKGLIEGFKIGKRHRSR